MKITIIKSEKIDSIILPNIITGNYWITDFDENGVEKNLISIEADNNQWKIISNNDIYIVENNIAKPFDYLKDYKFYAINNLNTNSPFLLFCSPVNSDYVYYNIDDDIKKGIVIGDSSNAMIQASTLSENAGYIQMNDKGEVILYDNKSKYGIYVNNVRIIDNKTITNGDFIFIIGVKIIFIRIGNSYYLGIENNGLGKINKLSTVLPISQNLSFSEPEEESEYKIYDQKNYFHKTPRFVAKIKPLVLQIDPPPSKVEEQNSSLILTIGPMLTMAMTSLVTGYSSISNVMNGSTTWEKATPSLVICGAMFASVFLWPIIIRGYEKRVAIKKEKERQKKYSDYIDKIKQTISKAMKEQSGILKNYYLDSLNSADTILKKYTTLWQKRRDDDDFLVINLGLSSYDMQIELKYPEEHFSMSDDNLKNMVIDLGKSPKRLISVPYIFSLKEKYITGITGNNINIDEYVRRLIMQVVAFHSYDDVKLVIFTDKNNEYEWEKLKPLPHLFSNNKNIRFYASNNEEYKEVSYYLEQIFNKRKEAKSDKYDTYYIIISDCFKKIRNFEIIRNILDNEYLGFSVIIKDEKVISLPEQCNTIIEFDRRGILLRATNDFKNEIRIVPELHSSIDYESCVKNLANVPIEIEDDNDGQIPNKIGFLEMFDVGKIEQLNILKRWSDSNPIMSLETMVGVGKASENIKIDLHEKYHGPHGLIAGMTGSGKSEFIITYILSMAVNYHPYEVQFILIDYKGGGLAGAFENSNAGLKLPHLVGTITNLDSNEIKRSLASVDSELKRRQDLFNKAREVSGESTIDIYKYQKMFRDKMISEPVSHLFIICDEFAELKNQQPEFMEQLISTARIGRSLGVHLILATQKPSGIVDPQIWSNTRFRVCMRVQDKSDSNEVIKCPDAAYLKQTGRFYFQVGYNEVFTLGQASWAGGEYIPADKVNKTLDTSVEVINNIGYVIKNIKTREKRKNNTEKIGEELVNLVKYMDKLAKEQNIKCKPLWLSKIPEEIHIEELASKYNYQKKDYKFNPIIGEYDVPGKQEQRLLTLPLSDTGNALVYGASGSGKDNFITTLIYSSMLYYTPEELDIYVIDFGAESLKMFCESSIVGNVLTIDNDEEINNIYKMIESTIEFRKNLFSDFNGDYYTYCKNSGKSVSQIIIIINNYEAYQENYSNLDDKLIGLTRECTKYGIYFVITVNTPNGVRFKLKQNFALTYALGQNNEDDYTTILGNVHKTYPAKIYGRGIIKTDGVYEFQTALVCDRDNITRFVKEKCKEYARKYPNKTVSVPVLPQLVTYNNIKNEVGKNGEIVIGIEKSSLDIIKINPIKNYITPVTSLDLSATINMINSMVNQIISLNKYKTIIINAEEYDFDDKYKKFYYYIDSDFNSIFEKLYNLTISYKEKYEQSNFEKSIFKDEIKTICIIVGLDTFKNKLNNNNKSRFGEIFTEGKELDCICYIFVDTIDNLQKVELESWYKNSVNNTYGIWLGNGINDQFSIKISQKVHEMKVDVPENFCFVILRGKAYYVKYVEKYDLKI